MKHLLILISFLLLGCVKNQGTETYPNGGKYVGSWKGGLKWNGTYYDQNGNITGKYVNGEWIKQ